MYALNSAPFEVSTETREGFSLIRLRGEFDLAGIDRFREVREGALAAGSDVIVDLSECTFIDSTGIGGVLRTADFTRSAGHRFVLVGSSPQVKRVLEVTRVADYVPTKETLDEAIAALAA